MAREIRVAIVGDASQLSKAFGQAGKQAGGFGDSLHKLAKTAAFAVGAAGIGGLAATLKIGAGEFAESSRVAAQTEARLKSTGGAANVTAGHVANLAGSLMNLSGVDDEAIQSGENLLLTFKGIKNAAGAGNDVFDQTTKTMLDMSVALGQDTRSSALQLGKALNDPIRGVTALQRVGVSFNTAQREQIKTLVESGKTMEAQKVILHELSTEFGHSAKAAGETLPGKLSILKENFNNLAGELFGHLVPALTSLTDWAVQHMPQIEAMMNGAFTRIGDAIKTVVDVGQSLLGFYREHKTLVQAVGAAIGAAAVAIEAITLATKAWTVAQIALSVAMTANPIGIAIVAVAALAAGLTVAYQRSETFRNIVNGAFDAVKTTIKGVADFVTVKLPAAFQGVKDWVGKHWPEIATLISGPFAPIVALATNAFGVRSALTGALGAIKSAASDRIDDVVGFFRALPGRIAGFAESVGTTFVSKLGDGLSSLGKKLRELVAGPLNALIGAWNDLGIPSFGVHIKLPGPAPDINFDFGGVSLPDIPKLAAGGIVTAPTLALIGEAGPEAVVPLGRGRPVLARPTAAGGGGSVYHVTVNAPNFVGSKDELARVVRDELNRMTRRQGATLFA